MGTDKIVKLLSSAVILLFIGLVFSFYLHFSKEKEKIVYVDTNRLLKEYKGFKAAVGEFEIKAKSWQARIDTLSSELSALIQQYELEKGRLGTEAKKEKENLIQTKQQQFVQYREAIQQKIAEEDKRLKEEVLAQVNDYIKEYGHKNAYPIILGATNVGNIVYGGEEVEVTAEILENLNKRYN